MIDADSAEDRIVGHILMRPIASTYQAGNRQILRARPYLRACSAAWFSSAGLEPRLDVRRGAGDRPIKPPLKIQSLLCKLVEQVSDDHCSLIFLTPTETDLTKLLLDH